MSAASRMQFVRRTAAIFGWDGQGLGRHVEPSCPIHPMFGWDAKSSRLAPNTSLYSAGTARQAVLPKRQQADWARLAQRGTAGAPGAATRRQQAGMAVAAKR